MTKGVIYYNRGSKCTLRMLISIFTLRKVYDGDILVLFEGSQPQWFLKALDNFNVSTKHINTTSHRNPLNVKSSLWRYSPFDLTMFMDADTVIIRPIDSYFDLIKENGFVTGKFSDWVTSGSRIRHRIKQWSPIFDKKYLNDAINYGDAINTGINGWVNGNPMLEAWEELCEKGSKYKCSDRVADEMACQLLLHVYPHQLAGVEWGTSVKYGIETLETKIIHYHGQKHVEDYPLCRHWKNAYYDLVQLKIIDFGISYDDRRLLYWLNKEYQDISEKMLTNVTAVNKKYLMKLFKNINSWMKIKYFKNHELIIMCDQDCINSNEIIEIQRKYSNVRITLIDNSLPFETEREKMLTAFVHGPPKFVRTKYWVKVDCDSYVQPDVQDINLDKEIFQHTLTGHKWHFTKVKSDPQYEKDNIHWLHKLDDICDKIPDFKGTKRLFDGVKSDGARITHSRIASFFSVELTKWTKHLSDICTQHNNGRLLVPSQDTLTWYCVTRLGNGRTVNQMNMKKYMRPS